MLVQRVSMTVSEIDLILVAAVLQVTVIAAGACYILVRSCCPTSHFCDMCGCALTLFAYQWPKMLRLSITLFSNRQHGPDYSGVAPPHPTARVPVNLQLSLAERERIRQQMVQQMLTSRRVEETTPVFMTTSDLFQQLSAADRESYVDNCLRTQVKHDCSGTFDFDLNSRCRSTAPLKKLLCIVAVAHSQLQLQILQLNTLVTPILEGTSVLYAKIL